MFLWYGVVVHTGINCRQITSVIFYFCEIDTFPDFHSSERDRMMVRDKERSDPCSNAEHYCTLEGGRILYIA